MAIVRNSMETKLDQSFQLSEVRNKRTTSVLSRLLDHIGAAPQGVVSLNPPPLKETYSDGIVVRIEWVHENIQDDNLFVWDGPVCSTTKLTITTHFNPNHPQILQGVVFWENSALLETGTFTSSDGAKLLSGKKYRP